MLFDKSEYANLSKTMEEVANVGEYMMDVEGGFSIVPPIIIVRALEDNAISSMADNDVLAKYCIKNKKVTMFYDGEQLGAFVMTSIDDDWATLAPFFNDHPMALRLLINICMAHIIKKSIPPRRKALPEAAAGVVTTLLSEK